MIVLSLFKTNTLASSVITYGTVQESLFKVCFALDISTPTTPPNKNMKRLETVRINGFISIRVTSEIVL